MSADPGGASLSWGGSDPRPNEDRDDEEDLEALLLRELDECEVCERDYEEEGSWARPREEASGEADGSPAPDNPHPPPGDPPTANITQTDEPVSSAWAAFLQSSSEVEERFTAMQQSVLDCRQLLLPKQDPPPHQNHTDEALESLAPASSEQMLEGEGIGGEGEEEAEAASAGEQRGHEEEEEEKGETRLLEALAALGPSIEGVISRARALVDDEEEEGPGRGVGGEGPQAAGPVRPPVAQHDPDPSTESAGMDEDDEEADGSGEPMSRSASPRQGREEEEEGLRAPSEEVEVQQPPDPTALPPQEATALTGEVVVAVVGKGVAGPASSLQLLELEARRQQSERAEEQRRLEAAQLRLRQEEERAAAAAEEERRVAAEQRRRRRKEAVERLRREEAAAKVVRACKAVLWRRRVLAALAVLSRAREAARRREMEGMAREERRMREVLQAQARQAAAETRRMAEEERRMRMWCRMEALERERAAFEARAMAGEEQLGRAVAAAARAREEAGREEAEGQAMATQDRDSRRAQEAWRAEREARRAVAEQKRLLATLLRPATSSSSSGGEAKEAGDGMWQGQAGLLPEHLQDQALRWASEGRDVSGRWAYACRRYAEWRRVVVTQQPAAAAMLAKRPAQEEEEERARRRSSQTLAPLAAAAAPPASRPGPASAGAGHRLSIETLQELSVDPLDRLTALELCVEGLSDVAALAHCPRLQRLVLNVNRLRDLSSLCGAASSSLVDVSVKDNGLTSLHGIHALTHLTDLVVDVNQLRSLEGVEAVPGLRSLSANTNAITDFPPFHRASASPLQRLLLYHNQIEWLPAERLRPLTSLTVLDLGRNRLSSVSGEALSCCLSLTKLVLSQNKLSSPPSPLHLPLLRELWLSGNRITTLAAWREEEPPPSNAGQEEAGGLRHVWLPSLRVLFLQDNRIDSDGFPPGCLLGCPLLEQLDLSFNRLARLQQDVGGLGLACPHLTSIQLHDNELCQPGPDYVTALLQHLPRLRDYDGNEVDEAKRWHALSQAWRGAHHVVPFMAELRRRGRDAKAMPASLLSDWRRAPRPLTCLSCHHEFLLHPKPPPAHSAAQLPPSVACPQCGSVLRHVDFAGSGPVPWEPVALDWEQVWCWHGYDASRRSMAPGPAPPAALARLLTRVSRDTADGGPVLAARHRRLLAAGEGEGEGEGDAVVERKAVVAREVEAWGRARLSTLMAAAEGGRDGDSWFGWEQEQRRPAANGPGSAAQAGQAGRRGEQGPSETAARRIQFLWRRFKTQRRRSQAPCPAPSRTVARAWQGEEEGEGEQVVEEAAAAAVTKLQSAFRGFHVRRALQAALESAKYVDLELEAILHPQQHRRAAHRGQGDEEADEDGDDLELLLALPPDDILDTWEYRGQHYRPRTPTRRPQPAHAALGPAPPAAALLLSGPSAFMPTPPRSARASRRDGGVNGGAAASSPSAGTRGGAMLAPLTAESSGMMMTAHDDHDDDAMSPKALSEPGGRGHNQHVKERALIDEWGITDDKLAHTLLQRRSRIKKLQGQQSRRENMKKSAYRYRRFVEQTARPPAVSGKQGGECLPPPQQPKTLVIGAARRGAGGAGGRAGSSDRRAQIDRRPAWASPGEDG